MKKRGWPKAKETFDSILHLRVTKDMYDKVESVWEACGLSKADFIRRSIVLAINKIDKEGYLSFLEDTHSVRRPHS